MNNETPTPTPPTEPEQFHTPMWVLTTFVLVSFCGIAIAVLGLPLR